MTEADARAGAESRVRRTTVPHAQRWRSPHQAGWNPRTRPHAEPPGLATSPFGRAVRSFRRLVVHSATPLDGACWEAAKRVELSMYAERNGWSDPSSSEAGEVLDYASYEDRSEIFVVTRGDDVHRPVGVARMIWGGIDVPMEEQFVVTDVHEIEPEWQWMLDEIGGPRIAEWATLGAVGANLSPMFALWAAAYEASRARGVDYWLQSVVDELLNVYRDGFKAPMLRIGPPRDFDGTQWTPTVLSLEEIGIGRMLAWNPDLKRSMFDGWVDRRPVPGPPARRVS